MKIGVLGGTFNPIHNAHLQMAAAARDALALDRVLIMVAADPPHKSVSGHTDARTRLHMACLGCVDCPRAEASGLELEREGKSYTADTLDELACRYPGAELYLIVGSDMLRDLHGWYRPDGIVRRARIACVPRRGQQAGDTEAAAQLENDYGAQVIMLPAAAEAMSSTEIRERLNAGMPVDTMMPMDALLFAVENGLYYPPQTQRLCMLVSGALTPKRWRHSAGAAVAAAHLAERWHADYEKARLAALLHDCAKNLSAGETRLLSGDDTCVSAVQHAGAGAVLAKTVYGVDDDAVLRAIRLHCTGDADMRLLDKLIFLADMIEPTRNYDGIDSMRGAVGDDPDAAMLFALRRNRNYVVERFGPESLHPATCRAISYFEGILKEEQH